MDRTIAFSLFLLGSSPVVAIVTHEEVLVHFEKDKAALNEQATALLDAFLASITLQGDHHFTIEGHTDSDGNHVYNDTLAAARAKVVRDYLLGHGVDPSVVKLGYRGERTPVASNANEVGMSLNRRVRITFTRNVFADVDELRQALREGSVQHFQVDPRRDTLLKGRAGSTVAFAASGFVDAKGNRVSSPVTVELTEALGALEMVAFGLSTRSDDRLLETDGMVQVLASDPSGNELRLRADAPMTVTMPAPVIKPRMQLFLSTTGTNWAVATSASDSISRIGWNDTPPRPPVIPFKLPTYKEDQHGKPLQPVLPVMPRVPTMSKERSYVRKDPWWGFMRPRVMQARTQKAFAHAERRKASSHKRYQARLERYYRENAEYPAAAQRYTIRKARWDERKVLEKEQWYAEVYQPALRQYDAIAGPLRTQYQAELAAWKRERNIRLERYAQWADSTRSTTVNGLANYVFTTTHLGWINCDRFYSTPPDRLQKVAAQVDQANKAQVYLVFTGMRMLLNMVRNEAGDHVSPLVPVDEPAVVFAFTVIDGQTQLCVRPVKRNEKPVLEFTPSTVAEVGKRLAELAGT